MKSKVLSEKVMTMIRKKLKEQAGYEQHLGHQHYPTVSAFSQTKGALEKRHWQKQANQSRDPSSYVAEEDVEELGKTDTGKKSKRNTEVVNINPTMKDIAGGGLTTTKGLERK